MPARRGRPGCPLSILPDYRYNPARSQGRSPYLTTSARSGRIFANDKPLIAGQIEGVQATPTAAEKEEWARGLIERWPKLDVNARKRMAAMPLTWATTRAYWPEMAEADRAEIKKGFAQVEFIKEIRSVFAKAKGEGGANTAAQMSKIQQDHQTMMTVLKMSHDASMTRIAAMRNLADSRYDWSYRPR